jgi:inner membrane protein
LLQPVATREDIHRLLRFSQQFYTVEKYYDTLVFNDLRFGQEVGWFNPRGKFAFHYYVNHPDKNALVVQRGRFAGWNDETARAFLKRIKGN